VIGWNLNDRGRMNPQVAGNLVFWLIVLALLFAASIFVIFQVRKMLFADDSDVARVPGFSLDELDRMLDQGLITRDEFNVARQQLISRLDRPLENEADQRMLETLRARRSRSDHS